MRRYNEKSQIVIELAKKQGFKTLKELADAAHIQQHHLSQIINEGINNYNNNRWNDTCVRIADLLNSNPEDIFGKPSLSSKIRAIWDREVTLSRGALPIHYDPGYFETRGNEAETELIKKDFLDALSQAMLILRPREAFVIVNHFGLYGNQKQTLEEIGKKMCITPEAVRRIEVRGIERLRHPGRSKELRPFLDVDFN
jgi:RNA polymerase sigma factor (sigma-70 family)